MQFRNKLHERLTGSILGRLRPPFFFSTKHGTVERLVMVAKPVIGGARGKRLQVSI